MLFKTFSIKTFVVFTFILVFVGNKTTEFERWDNIDHVINHDMKGYYAYLPAFFVQKDISFSTPREMSIMKYVWAKEYSDKKLIKYSTGVSLVHTPAFLIAHAYASSNDSFVANGYSKPYAWAFSITAFIFFFLALVYAHKLLLLFFTENASLLTILCLFLGTNIFHHTYFNLNTSHVYSVTFGFMYLYYGIHWLKQSSLKNSFFVGLSLAFLILIRPVDILFFPLPFILSMTKSNTLKQLILYTFSNYKKLIFIAGVSFIVFLPQFLYNYHITGHFIFYSYTEEGFFFANPQFFNILFSFRNGWILYSPILIFGFIGLALLVKKQPIKWSLLIFILVLYLYVISSWWCWWYAGFGNRACINLLPLMSIPFAHFLQTMLKKNVLIKLVLGSVLSALILFNWFQARKYSYGIIHHSSMSAEAYAMTWNTFDPPQLYELKLKHLNMDSALHGVYISNFPSFDTVFIYKNLVKPADRLLFNQKQEFGFSKKISVKNVDRIYIEAKGTHPIFAAAQGDSLNSFFSCSNEIKAKNKDVFTVHNWVNIGYYSGDSLLVYIWNKDKVVFTLEDLKITGLKSREP